MAAAGRSIHFEHSVLGYFNVIPAPPRSKDRTGQRRLINAVLEKSFVDVNRDDLAKNKPSLDRLPLPVLELDDLGNFAFHRGATFAHAWDADMAARSWCQPRSLKFTDTACQRAAVLFICLPSSLVKRFQTNSRVSKTF